MDSERPLFAGLSVAAQRLWAKSGTGENWLPLVQHMADSAGVAQLLWTEWASPKLRAALAEECGLSDDDAGVLFAWLACVHDIGKASRQFTTQLDKRRDPEHDHFSSDVAAAGLSLRLGHLEGSKKLPHATASRTILRLWLVEELGLDPFALRNICAVVDAHHGLPSLKDTRDHADGSLSAYEAEWKAVWRELLGFAADFTGVRPVFARFDGKQLRVTSQMLLSGLVIMADWIASNQDAFPMTVGPQLHDEAPLTRFDQQTRVQRGFLDIELSDPWQAEPRGALDELMRDRFGWELSKSPRPVQSAIASLCNELTGPSLIIIEAPTGEGKTEAALLAAELRAKTEGSGGVFFGAPTTATSDALFNRVVSWAGRAVPGGTIASMYLGHSRRTLNETYRGLRRAQINSDDSQRGWVAASQWLSGRKKGLLSNMVVGTVDQLLIMALQSKHSMLRHLALADKIVIVDEVHAYDAYMGEYLHRALEWLAAYGATVILLSATLPSEVKRGLLSAYADAIKVEVPEQLSLGYPLITSLSRVSGFRETAVQPRDSDARIELSILDDDLDELVKTLERETELGGCVLVLCNSVIRAQSALEALPKALRRDSELLHARFIAADRLTREQRLTSEMGPSERRGSGRPHRRIIIATQVAEQSLDIDVDLLITDIAPMDLLVQRMGRLHRHCRPESDRPENLRMPRTLIRAIRQTEPVPEFDPHASGIYGDRLLLSTLLQLQRGPLDQGFTRPDDAPALVQGAYKGLEPDAEASAAVVPEAWQGIWIEAHAKHMSKRESARSRAKTFRFPRPCDAREIQNVFSQSQADIAKDASSEERGYAQVRDSEPSLEAILICDTADGYQVLPWLNHEEHPPVIDDAEPSWQFAHMLARSMIRLPQRCAGYGSSQFEEAITQLERQTPQGWRNTPILHGLVALRVDENFEATLNGVRMKYDIELGLQEVRERADR